MPGFLKQSTASQSRAIGPFVSDSDFKTVQTGLTIANTDIKLIVNGGASANKNSGGGTHRAGGIYGITFDATDTATVGTIDIYCGMSGALPVFDRFVVLEEVVYDAIFAASALGYIANAPVDVVKISGDSTAADNAESFFDGTGYAGTNNVIPTVTNLTNNPGGVTSLLSRLGIPIDINGGGSTVAGNVTDVFDLIDAVIGVPTVLGASTPDLAGNMSDLLDAINAVKGDVWEEDPANHNSLNTFGRGVRVGTNNDKTGYGLADGAITAAKIASDAISAAAVKADAATKIANAVEAAILDEGDATALLAAIAAKVETFLINEGDATATLAAIAAAVRTNLATELARMDAAISTRLASASYTAPPSAATNASAVRTELATELGRIDVASSTLATAASQTTILNRLGAFTGSGVNTVLGFFKSLLSKSASTPSDVGGTFDASTDSAEAIRDAGFSTLDAAGVRAAVGLAAADLDDQLTAISDKTINLPNDPADASAIADALSALQTHGDNNWTGGGGDAPTADENAIAVLQKALEGNMPSGSLGEAVFVAATAAVSAKAVTDKLDTMLEQNTTVYRFTAESLFNTPAGGGGGGGGDCPTSDEIASAVRAALAGTRVTTQSTVLEDGTLEVVNGDDYADADSRAIRLTITNYGGPSVSGGAFTLALQTAEAYNAGDASEALELSGSAAMDGSDAVFTFEATAAQTAQLSASPPDCTLNHVYQVAMVKSGRRITLLIGAATIKKSIL